MKYRLNIQKKSGFIYSVEDGFLKINDTLITPPIDESIIEFDITDDETALGITRCYREGEEVICNLTKYVDNLDPYKTYKVKDGKPSTLTSKWDLSRLMTVGEVINGNPIISEGEGDV